MLVGKLLDGFGFFWFEKVSGRVSLQKEGSTAVFYKMICFRLFDVLLRPGNVILFIKPGKKPEVELGMVLSAWRGIKQPRLHHGETPCSSCVGFRVVELAITNPRDEVPFEWQCNSESKAWVVRMESLITILDVERCTLSAFQCCLLFLDVLVFICVCMVFFPKISFANIAALR